MKLATCLAPLFSLSNGALGERTTSVDPKKLMVENIAAGLGIKCPNFLVFDLGELERGKSRI
jgi:hypothetical protein